MKSFGRILIILACATLIFGAAWGLQGNNANETAASAEIGAEADHDHHDDHHDDEQDENRSILWVLLESVEVVIGSTIPIAVIIILVNWIVPNLRQFGTRIAGRSP